MLLLSWLLGLLLLLLENEPETVSLQANFKIEYLCPDIDLKEITAAVRGPNGADVECHLSLGPNGGTGYFVPTQVGMHEVMLPLKKKQSNPVKPSKTQSNPVKPSTTQYNPVQPSTTQ